MTLIILGILLVFFSLVLLGRQVLDPFMDDIFVLFGWIGLGIGIIFIILGSNINAEQNPYPGKVVTVTIQGKTYPGLLRNDSVQVFNKIQYTKYQNLYQSLEKSKGKLFTPATKKNY